MTFVHLRRSTVIHGVPAALLVALAFAASAFAQSTTITPTTGPGALGTTTSVTGNTTNITGGTQPGGGPNLFHSFNQFSVGIGDVANFVHATGVQNVIGRVMGGSPSNINGTVQALNANLYFLNPAGIIFGPAAHLNVSGSAYFSTAQQLRLGDNGVFTANPGLVALDATLSSSPPVAFGFAGQGPYGNIVLTSSSTLLQTSAVLGLMGGGIQINGSKIQAQKVVLGSTSTGGEMSTVATNNNPLSGVPAIGGQVQATPGTLIIAGGGGVIAPAIIVQPALTVPSGARADITQTNGRVTQIQVVQIPGQVVGALPSLPVAGASSVLGFNPINPIAFLNRAAVLTQPQAPTAPTPLLTSRCASQNNGAFSSLVQATRDVTPTQPGMTLPTPAVLEDIGTDSGTAPSQASQAPFSPLARTIDPWQGC